MLCRVAAVRSLPVHHHSAGYIYFHWYHWTHPDYFENRIPLMQALGGAGKRGEVGAGRRGERMQSLKIEYRLGRRWRGGGGVGAGRRGWGSVCSLENYSVAYEETQSNRVSDLRDFVCSLFSKAIIFDIYFNSSVPWSEGIGKALNNL